MASYDGRRDDTGGFRMGRSKRSTSRRADRADHWLGSEQGGRDRRWAYEELLFSPDDNGAWKEELDAVAADLAVELAALKRMQSELYDQVVRVAGLEGRIEALRNIATESAAPLEAEVEAAVELRSLPSDPSLPRAAVRIASLARCEGFQVESRDAILGYVEGLRFVSRIDEPDLLEVRGGRFGRELVLIPAEAVEEVFVEEERLVVRGIPAGVQDDHPHELVRVLRRALHHEA
jgi:hypothetical protein